MNKISIKLSISDYKYLCLIIKELAEASPETGMGGYLLKSMLTTMYRRFAKKLMDMKQSGTAIFTTAELMLFYSMLTQYEEPSGDVYDGNFALIINLRKEIKSGVEEAIKKDMEMSEVMI